MYKYEIGDPVVITGAALLCLGQHKYIGTVTTVTGIDTRAWSDYSTNGYYVACDDGYYCWKESWLEPVEDEQDTAFIDLITEQGV